MADRTWCNQPDRDVPNGHMICGYPLPCPWHTGVIHDGIVELAPEMPADPDTIERLIQVAQILKPQKAEEA